MHEQALEKTIRDLTAAGKGILAADESVPTMTKRLRSIGVDSTPETRRAFRELVLSTRDLGAYVSGVILFEETLQQQAADGTPLPRLAQSQGIVPGIKVDKGTIDLANAPGEKITEGLDGLAQRLDGYRQQGARFAKWRNVYTIGPGLPSPLAIAANAEVLARYAAICQAQGLVPIVEPEVLMDGDHSIERCAEVTEAVISAVYAALGRHRVVLEHTLLKPNMVTPGKSHPRPAAVEEVADWTLQTLRRSVPAAVPSINFLSGGQSDELATAHLNAMNRALGRNPWEISFSYGRALQAAALKAWSGKAENVRAAQKALLARARLNSLARLGKYEDSMEKAA
ncbi:MAG: fructose-bisphosphate aldolase class I [Pseudomonadota bacterium]|nr:fructose-bisphosphate aldolase class I [Pseudomonadota bacterium]